MTEQQVDLSQISPDEFAELVSGADDEYIADTIHAVGTEKTLDRIFSGFEERFRPEKAEGVDADIQFLVTDEGSEHPYVVAIEGGSCSATRGSADGPRTTLTMGLVPFCKLVTGNADGVQLFMTRKLTVSGDLMFAQRVMTFFDRPGR